MRRRSARWDPASRAARSTPSTEPISGSIFSSTPACDAGTCVMPQFHSSVVVAVHSTPLAASASHAFSRDMMHRRQPVEQRHAQAAASRSRSVHTPSPRWRCAAPSAACSAGPRTSAIDQREHHQQVAGQGRTGSPAACALAAAQRDQRRAHVEPASATSPSRPSAHARTSSRPPRGSPASCPPSAKHARPSSATAHRTEQKLQRHAQERAEQQQCPTRAR